MIAEYITLGAYLVLLPMLGVLFSRFNRNMSDYVRGGAQVTWWLSGLSILMASTSAFTFTGNASAAFLAGPSVLVIYAANVTALVVCAAFLGAWFRQTRGHTTADVVKTRFGAVVEQFYAYTGVITQPVAAAIQLWALSVFASGVFEVPILWAILLIGAIVVFYSTTGGKWAVMATDFVQGLILFAITVLVAVLCYIKIGGFGEFFSYFSKPEFKEDFTFVKEPGAFSTDRFSQKWLIVIYFMTIYHQLTLNAVDRFLVVKDGREARRSAALGAALMFFGTLIWFFPPMVARFLYGTEIMAQDMDNPAETAYSYIAKEVLPKGLMGIMIAAMFSATMSSMDSGLNRQVGILARNMVPRIRAFFGKTSELTPSAEVVLCKCLTAGVGSLIIFYSILFAMNKELILFDAYLLINSIITIPLLFPMLMGLWIKKLPRWSYFWIFGWCMVPSLVSLYDSKVNGVDWTIQDRAMWIFIVGFVAALVSIPFYKNSPAAYKERVEKFFRDMRTPVDFAKEIGESRNRMQYRMLGTASIGMGSLFLLFLINPDGVLGVVSVLFIFGFCAGIGGLLLWADRVEGRRERSAAEQAAAAAARDAR